MYAHTYAIEVDQNLVKEAFRKRKKRKIGSIELYLSVMPQDVPRVRIKSVAEERGKVVIEFEPVSISVGSWESTLMYKDEQSGLEIYQDPIYGHIRTVKFPADKIEEFKLKIGKIRQKVEEELANMEWEGRKVAQLDMKERQLDLLTKPEIIQEMEVLVGASH